MNEDLIERLKNGEIALWDDRQIPSPKDTIEKQRKPVIDILKATGLPFDGRNMLISYLYYFRNVAGRIIGTNDDSHELPKVSIEQFFAPGTYGIPSKPEYPQLKLFEKRMLTKIFAKLEMIKTASLPGVHNIFTLRGEITMNLNLVNCQDLDKYIKWVAEFGGYITYRNRVSLRNGIEIILTTD